MSFSANMKKVAVRLLNKYGNDIMLVIRSGGVYNPITAETDYIVVNTPARAYVGNFTVDELSSDNVNAMDMKVIISVDTHIIKDDILSIEGNEVQIISVRTVTTQNANIVQILQARAVA